MSFARRRKHVLDQARIERSRILSLNKSNVENQLRKHLINFKTIDVRLLPLTLEHKAGPEIWRTPALLFRHIFLRFF